MARKKCRLWFPELLLTSEPTSSFFIFGWYMLSVDSIDIVVAGAVPSEEISNYLTTSNLEKLLTSIDERMPIKLYESSTFSIIGHCDADVLSKNLKIMTHCNDDNCLGSKEEMHFLEPEENSHTKDNGSVSINRQLDQEPLFEGISGESFARSSCGCEKLDKSILPFGQSLMESDCWVLLFCKPQGISSKKIKWIPEFHHIHLNDHVVSFDVHIIIYERPVYGISHLSLSSWNPLGSCEQVRSLVKKPNWFEELQKKPINHDLESAVLSLNCASAAMSLLEQSKGIMNPVNHFYISMLFYIIWHIVAVMLASVSTMMYIFFQLLHKVFDCGSSKFLSLFERMFKHTWKNVQIRSSQFLYWPISLQDIGSRFQSDVECLHLATLRRHFISSNIAMDLLFGIVFGVTMLANVEVVCFWVSVVAHGITENLLRSESVWLMGVPAGFKLNNELAEILGVISLNVIQIYSTIWIFLGTALRPSIQVLAFSGIFFGLTVPAALCIDVLKLATLHVSSLHWLVSLLYSQQIQALASLWRIFRGRKLNPLRQRLDSYDYTVEQHVVGSLLFTPLLLLLPTTSVFHVFFTCLCTLIALICITFEVTISILHATPYAHILLWFIRRRRFPSGVWFNIINTDYEISNKAGSVNLNKSKADCLSNEISETLVSLLYSNYATLGQVIAPHYRSIFGGVPPSFAKSMAHGILSGQRFPYTLHTRLPRTMPWMQIGFIEYWKLCYNIVISSD